MPSLSLVHYKVKRLIPFPALPKSASKEDICSLHLMTHWLLAFRNSTTSQFHFWHQGYLFWLISSGICWFILRLNGQMWAEEWSRMASALCNKPVRAGPELYLDPVYIFQGTEGGKSWNFWYLITERPWPKAHCQWYSFKADSLTTSGMVALLVLVTLCHFLLWRARFFDVFGICTSTTERTKLRSQ